MQPSAYPTVCHRTSDIGRRFPGMHPGACRFGSGEGGSDTASLALHAARVPGSVSRTRHSLSPLAGGRAGGAVRIKNEKTFIHDGSRDTGATELSAPTPVETRARTARTRAGGGRYYIQRPGSSRSRGTLLCVAHDGIAARKACSDDGERARRTEVCRNARKVQPQAARQLTLVFGPDTISQAAWRWAVGHGLARLGDPPSVRAANELPATAPSRACMRLSSRVRCRLRACSWPEIANHIPDAHGPRSPIISPRSPSIAPRSPIIAPRSPIIAPRSPIIAPRSPIIAPRSPRVRHDAPPEWPVASP